MVGRGKVIFYPDSVFGAAAASAVSCAAVFLLTPAACFLV